MTPSITVRARHAEHRRGRSRLQGPRPGIGAYLLALAIARGGRFVTFDGSFPLSAVRGATERHLAAL